MEVVAVMEVVACSVGGSRLCWFASLCGGRLFMHVLFVCQPTGSYALILIYPFLLHVVAIPLCRVSYPSRLKFEVVDVRVH